MVSFGGTVVSFIVYSVGTVMINNLCSHWLLTCVLTLIYWLIRNDNFDNKTIKTQFVLANASNNLENIEKTV